jgi:hypothetical protein
MKLRGAFDPRVQIVLGVLMIVIFTILAVSLWTSASDVLFAAWVRLDLRLLPICLLLGLALGIWIGKLRLQALRKVLPEVDGQLFLSERRVLSKTREGENAITLQRLGFFAAFLAWFALTTFTSGRILLYGSMAAYVLGQYLTGQTLPFVRLFLELRKNRSSTCPS